MKPTKDPSRTFFLKSLIGREGRRGTVGSLLIFLYDSTMKPTKDPSRTFFLKTLNVLPFLSQRRIFLYDFTMNPLKNPSLEGRGRRGTVGSLLIYPL